MESDYVVPFVATRMNLFQEAVRQAKERMGSNNPRQGIDTELDQLVKLSDLKSKGILTEQEFEKKKTQILGL